VAFYQNQEIQDKIDSSEYQQFINRPLRNLADLKSKLHLNNPLFSICRSDGSSFWNRRIDRYFIFRF
jgi:hypothetical protein